MTVDDITLCNECNCMTKTFNGKCGKCGAAKPVPHWACGKIDCDCDEQYMEARENDEFNNRYQSGVNTGGGFEY